MRAAILVCEDAPKWQGYTRQLWGKILETQDDTLTPFRCYEGEFPDLLTCRERFDVVMVSGSHYSAYDDVAWIRQLEQLLPQYIASGVRVVGSCFGHQILAKALGGSVGKNPSGRFVLGVEQVDVNVAAARACGLDLPAAAVAEARGAAAGGGGGGDGRHNSTTPPATASATTSGVAQVGQSTRHGGPVAAAAVAGGSEPGVGGSDRPGLSGASRPLRLRLLESHGDQVLELPPGATPLATSGTATHEMWAIGDRCLAFQFHPELTTDLVYDKIWTALSSSGRLSPEEAATAEAQLKGGEAGVDSELFWRALRWFVRLPAPAPLPEGPHSAARPPPGAAAAAAVDAAAEAAAGGANVAAEIRRALERQTEDAAEAVVGHIRQAAAAGMSAGTSSAELLTALNREAAGAYGRAASVAEHTAERVGVAVATQQEPLKAALASLGALEAQLDRLAAVVGSLEQESVEIEQQAQAQAGHQRG